MSISFKVNKWQVGQSDVDFAQQQIITAGQVFSVQQKTLRVLQCLINAQGEIVTTEHLMENIWGDTIVTANTVQRCIAQLRKALGDSSQQQKVIKTFPKRGYALVVSSTAIHIPPGAKATQSAHFTGVRILQNGYVSAFAIVLFSVFIYTTALWLWPTEPHTPSISFDTVMVNSDSYTAHPQLSPLGTDLLFQRYSDSCSSTIWVQNNQTKQQSALTKQEKMLNDISWHKEGKQLLTVESNPCRTPSQAPCWQIQKLHLEGSRIANKTAIGRCQKNKIVKLAWWDLTTAIGIEYDPTLQKHTLIKVALNDSVVTPLFTQGDILSFAKLNTSELAVISRVESNKIQLFTLSLSGTVQHQRSIDYKGYLSRFSNITLHVWQTNQAAEHALLIEANEQIFSINSHGQLLPVAKNLHGLSDFYFSKTDQYIFATRERIKRDLYFLDKHSNTVQPILASKAQEQDLRVSPDQSLSAFISNQTGQNEIWLSGPIHHQHNPKQLTQFNQQVQIRGMEWLSDNSGLLVNINDDLYRITLEGEQIPIKTPQPLKYLYQVLDEQHALVEYQHQFDEVLAILNLNTKQLSPLYAGQISDGAIDSQGNLWVIDKQNQLYKVQGNNITPSLKRVNSVKRDGKNLYVSSKQNTLYHYQSDTAKFKELTLVPPKNSWLEAVTEQGWVFAKKQSINSDIVRLTWD